MKRSLILLEFKNISTGFFVLDEITKNFNVDIEILRLLCPGRYMIICSGNQGEIENLRKYINEIKENEKHKHITERLVSGVDEELLKKINRNVKFSDDVKSLGILEFSNTIQAIETADFIEDESPVEILTIKIGLGMCNKGIVIFTGDTSSVVNIVERIEKMGLKELISSEVINSPNREFLNNFHF
ncbi:BMC domain-containing protein [Fusobacterium varium]|jgi:microcompartment protein CcmL/EutN|uniref:BMC domain-containing protein n=1 Tax=Fusobacterium varium TaxID=856 RepID=UPI002431F18E|nr:BMC domain-containing protein [Fusobacterium varium]MCF0170464.1 BMC domain-containing protein [Fusobacterium varium]